MPKPETHTANCPEVSSASLASADVPVGKGEGKPTPGTNSRSAKIGQSKKYSFLESLFNVAIGYGIALVSQILVFPLFGIHIPLHDNILIGLVFTVISICRSYALRRLFNWYHLEKAS